MTLEEVNQEVNFCLNRISKCFKPEAKLTFLARIPNNDEADYVLTNDDLPLAIEALKRRCGG